jgi:hypothetical protein
MSRCTKDGTVRAIPLKLIGFSTDSAGHQLSAAATLMTPTLDNVEAGIPYLGLGVPGERFLAPYFSEFPSIAYLDYLHERRLFLKNLKYTTRDLILGEDGGNSSFATIEHLKELKKTCGVNGVDCGLKESDLLLIHFMDQNQDACNAVFALKTSHLLDQYVPGSQGTSLYIHAAYHLTEPFHDPKFGSPSKIQESVSTGITILRLWKKSVELQKLRINAKTGAANEPKNRGNFLTYGSCLTAEVQFAAATAHCLMMFLHFFNLGPTRISPHFSGTKATERIISELQGKTTHIQCLDAQPTYGDIVHRISNVQYNQAAQKRVCLSGGKVTSGANNKKTIWDYTSTTESCSSYCYPSSYTEFVKEQREAHYRGVKRAQELCNKYMPQKVVTLLKQKKCWEVPYSYEKPNGITVIGDLTDLPSCHNLIENMCRNKIVVLEQDVEDLECRDDDEEEDDDDQTLPAPDLDLEDESESLKGNAQWYITREVGPGILTKMHIKRAISILLPREYIPRERSRRHWTPKYISQLKPPEEDHDILQFRDIAYRSSNDVTIGRVIMIQSKSKSTSVRSAKSSSNDVIFRCRTYLCLGSNDYEVPGVPMISPWRAASSFLCEVYLEKGPDGILHASKESCSRLDQMKKKTACTITTEKQQELEPDMFEVSDIVDRRLDRKTQTYEYKVRFQGYAPEEDVWLPSAAFNQAVEFESQSRYGRKRKHHTSKKDEIDPFSAHFVQPVAKKKKT